MYKSYILYICIAIPTVLDFRRAFSTFRGATDVSEQTRERVMTRTKREKEKERVFGVVKLERRANFRIVESEYYSYFIR